MFNLKPKDFKIGTIFYECEAGLNIQCVVTSLPVASTIEINDKKYVQWSWQAQEENGKIIEYLYTEGLAYGGRYYSMPQYLSRDEDGSLFFQTRNGTYLGEYASFSKE